MAVEFEQRGPFAVVKINRPESGNAAALQTERGGFGGITQRERTKPIIAAVDGPALAGGTDIVLSCDLVVASTTATFGIPEVKRSLVAAAGGLFRLGRKIPLNLAMGLTLTGDPIDAKKFFVERWRGSARLSTPKHPWVRHQPTRWSMSASPRATSRAPGSTK